MLNGILNMYNPALAGSLVGELAHKRNSALKLLYWFWHTKDYRSSQRLTDVQRSLSVLLGVCMVAQIGIGIGFLVEWARYGTVGAWEFGLALLLSYPLIWAHVVVFLTSIGWLGYFFFHPKQAARSLICTIFELQVRQLRARHNFKVVAVVGSVGKTSTKLAVADLLVASGLRVRHQTGNYNDRVTVPLVFFGLNEPSLYNPFAWWRAFGISQSEIALPFPYDVVVVELGTDGPGQMEQFAYIKPDITVVTAVSPEHMEYFGDLDGVAAEELSVFEYSKQVLVNGDDIAGEYLAGLEFAEYSLLSEQAQYKAIAKAKGLVGQELTMYFSKSELTADIRFLGEQGAKVTLAAAAVADMLGVKKSAIQKALPDVAPFAGRMQVLPGIKDSTLIDDTYNSSPLAVKAALDVLYAAKNKQRIAILGSMNELGAYSRQAHDEVGEYCDPKKLGLVVTIGHDAKKWLAPVAKKNGCTVQTFLSPYEAGAYVSGKLQKGGVVLAKGSQNGVFAEEALKPLLADPTDEAKLVRQSPRWMTKKQQQFPS